MARRARIPKNGPPVGIRAAPPPPPPYIERKSKPKCLRSFGSSGYFSGRECFGAIGDFGDKRQEPCEPKAKAAKVMSPPASQPQRSGESRTIMPRVQQQRGSRVEKDGTNNGRSGVAGLEHGTPVEAPRSYVVPAREWERTTELIKMIIATGAVVNARKQSIILISEPGSGKTELIDRFADVNPQLAYVSDMTSLGLEKILRRARMGQVTHVVANELQKVFMRKASTWTATLGMLCQALEEGVRENHNREHMVDLGGAQVGLIAGLTHDTARQKSKLLRETGFWSRVAAVDWEMPQDELLGVMRSITESNRSDVTKVKVQLPERPITVEFPVALGRQFEQYVMQQLREYTVLRIFQRLRAVAMACAVLDGRDMVHPVDVEKVVAFGRYWRPAPQAQ